MNQLIKFIQFNFKKFVQWISDLYIFLHDTKGKLSFLIIKNTILLEYLIIFKQVFVILQEKKQTQVLHSKKMFFSLKLSFIHKNN